MPRLPPVMSAIFMAPSVVAVPRAYQGTACPWLRAPGVPIMYAMDRDGLADFLRRRRAALQPDDVGLGQGRRRRTPGLRREEVAGLAHMSTDFYARLEQRRGSRPSEATVGALARALRLTEAERDHLFRLAGHAAPPRGFRSDHVTP